MMNSRNISGAGALAFLMLAGGLEAAPYAVWEGFELGGTQWATEGEGSVLEGRIARDVASEGARAFGGRVEILSLEKSPKPGFFLQPEADFSGVDELRFDLFLGARGAWDMKLIIQTGPAWDWHETEVRPLAQGWNRNLGVDFRSHRFNKDAPTLLRHRQAVAKIQILVTPREPSQGGIYLDNVRLSGPGAAALAPRRLPGTREFLANDFEGRDSGWKAVHGAAVKVEPDQENYSKGGQGLRLATLSTNPDQTAIFGVERDMDVSRIQSLVVDVHNPGGHSLLSLGLAYGADWAFCESPAARLRPGWNYNVTFDLQSKNFKSAASGWKNNGPIPDPKGVRRAGFSYAPGAFGPGGLTIDNLRVRALSAMDAVPFQAPEEAKGMAVPWEEGPGLVRASSDFSEATGVGVSGAYVSGGAPSLALKYRIRSESASASFQILKSLDLLGVRALEFDAYNPDEGSLELGLAAKVGDTGTWMESRGVRLAPGWNRGVRLLLEGPVFKSAETQWAYSAALPERKASAIKEAFIQVAPAALGPGEVYLSNLNFLRRPDLGAWGVPITFQGSYTAAFTLDTASYALWDSGASEGNFESGTSAWSGMNGGGFDLSAVSASPDNASLGSKSLRVDMRGTGANKAVAVFDPSLSPGAAFPDLADKTRIRLDVFNPGPPLAVGLAFNAGAANDWFEAQALVLKPGWNRDISFDLDANIWKLVQDTSGSVPGATQVYGQFPKSLRGPASLKKMFLIFHKATAGSVYVDNIRLGSAGSSSTLGAEAGLGAHLYAGRHLDVEASAVAGKSGDGSAYVLPGKLAARLKGLGQEVSLSFGQALSPFDDQLALFTGRTGFNVGYDRFVRMAAENLAALQHRGSFGDYSLQTLAAIPWYEGLYSPGVELIAGVRAKSSFGSRGYLGVAFISHRVGYDPGANPLTAPSEQSVQAADLDAELHLPFDINLSGGVGQTSYAAAKTYYLLRDPRGIPLLFSKAPGSQTSAYKIKGDWTLGAFTLGVAYADVGADFYTALSDDLYAAKKLDSKILTKLDHFAPVKRASGGKGWAAMLLKGLTLETFYGIHDNADLTYKSRSIDLRLENSKTEKAGFVLGFNQKKEEKSDTAGLPLPGFNGMGEKFILRMNPWTKTRMSLGGVLSSFDSGGPAASNTTFGLELSQKVMAGMNASVAAGSFGYSGTAASQNFMNLHARLEYQPGPWLASELAFGRRPFSDDELSWNWLETDPRVSLTVKGSF